MSTPSGFYWRTARWAAPRVQARTNLDAVLPGKLYQEFVRRMEQHPGACPAAVLLTVISPIWPVHWAEAWVCNPACAAEHWRAGLVAP
jgi:uncharacterized membrane protein